MFQRDRDSQAQWPGSLWLPVIPASGVAQTGRKSFRGPTDSAAALDRKPPPILQTQIISTALSSSWELFSLSLTGDYGAGLRYGLCAIYLQFIERHLVRLMISLIFII